MDTKNLVIALHSLAPHGANYPVAVIGTNNRIIDHARFDQKANRHVCRLPYDVWEKEGEGIVKTGTNPTNQWFPKVEAKEEAQPNPAQQSPAEAAGFAVEPTHAPIQDKLPEEVTPGHLTLPEGTDTTHIPEEPPTPHEQLTTLDDQRIQMVQTVVPEAGKETPTDRVVVNTPADAQLEVQPTPNEQLHKLDDPRIELVQDVVNDADEAAPAPGEPGGEKDQAKAELKAVAEDKQSDRNADLDAAGNDFRKLRKIAQVEGVEDLGEIKTSKDMRAAIELKRDEAAGK